MYSTETLKTIDQLKNIFLHYSKQNLGVRGDYTFEDIKEDKGVLTMHKLTAVLTDFEIAAHPKVSYTLLSVILESSRVIQENLSHDSSSYVFRKFSQVH